MLTLSSALIADNVNHQITETHWITVQAMWLQPDVFSIIVPHPGHGFATTAGESFRTAFVAAHSSQLKPDSCGSSAAHTWRRCRVSEACQRSRPGASHVKLR